MRVLWKCAAPKRAHACIIVDADEHIDGPQRLAALRRGPWRCPAGRENPQRAANMTDESEAASGCSVASENCDSDGEYSYHDSDGSDGEAIKPAYDEADALAAALHETEWDDLARQLARSEAEAERRMMEWEEALAERHRAETSERLKMEQQEKKKRMIARIPKGFDAVLLAASLSTRDHTVTEADVRGGAARPIRPFARDDRRRRAHERPSSATSRRAGPQSRCAPAFPGR